jgi:hypothetical protein
MRISKKMLDCESSDFYLSDSSSTTSSTALHTNNTSGDEPENNVQHQLYSLITLHPSTEGLSPSSIAAVTGTSHHNHLVTTDIQIISGLNHHPHPPQSSHHLTTTNNDSNGSNSVNLTTLTPASHVSIPNQSNGSSIIDSRQQPNPIITNNNSLISVDIIGSSTAPIGGCGNDTTMIVETVNVSNGRQLENSNGEVTTTTVVNGNGDVVAERKKNPVGR